MKGAETAWRSWRFDNQGEYPRSAARFVKSVYMEGFEDGANKKQHNEMMTKLSEISAKLTK